MKDPTGQKRSVTADLYIDIDDIERLHSKFISLYSKRTEYHRIILDMDADLFQRRNTYHLPACRDPERVSMQEYLSISSAAARWLPHEQSMKTHGATPAARARLSEAPPRVNAIGDLEQRMRSVENRQGAPTVANGVLGATQGVRAASQASPQRSPSPSGSVKSDSFVDQNGHTRYNGQGMPDVVYTEVLKAAATHLNKVVSLEYLKIPAGVGVDDFLNICELRPQLLAAVWKDGRCEKAVAECLAYVSPANAYGGPSGEEGESPVYSSKKVSMTMDESGDSSHWAEGSCPTCANSPPWDKTKGTHPPTTTACLYRTYTSSAHNPKKCKGRIITALLTFNREVIECIRPDEVKFSKLMGK